MVYMLKLINVQFAETPAFRHEEEAGPAFLMA
jgi:hypothetical protein